MRRAALFLALTLSGFAGAATAADAPKPFLSPAAEPDELAILPAPPQDGSPLAQADRERFTATRGLVGTPRWSLATADAERAPAALWADFSCALGATIPAETVPAVLDLMGRLNGDVEQATKITKAHYKRPRPLVGNEAPLCVPRTAALAESYSFPSGHAMQGWGTALVLAELAPDRATQLLQRGAVFGDSRVVCGVHWMSDVEASRQAGAILVAALHGNSAFRQAVETARAELAKARGAERPAPETAACHIEAEAAAHPVSERP